MLQNNKDRYAELHISPMSHLQKPMKNPYALKVWLCGIRLFSIKPAFFLCSRGEVHNTLVFMNLCKKIHR